MDALKYIHEQVSVKRDFPELKPGDNIVVSYEIVEGDKRRTQDFKGNIIKINSQDQFKTITVRKISSGVGVERIFPLNNPFISDIKVLKKGKVRRAKLYYLRKLVGKQSRIKEKSEY